MQRKLHKLCSPCKASAKDAGVCNCTNIEPKKDCLEFYRHSYKINGVYRLQKGPGFHTVHVFCDQTTQDSSIDFKRT